MTYDQTLTLMMALVAERPLTSKDIAQGLDRGVPHAYYVAKGLASAGALRKEKYVHHWAITEKGRIACALAMVKDPDLHAAFFG